eukprot:6195743-Pleurochrysis_carterae.AAC.1
MADRHQMAAYVRFHERAVATNVVAYGSSKAVVNRSRQGVRVVCTPPLIIEVCRRSHERLMLCVTCNLFTYNDLDGLSLPPHFKYAAGESEGFKQLALEHLMGMSNMGHKMSALMQKLLPPAYRDGEQEGEEAELYDGSEHSEHSGQSEA